MSVIVCGESIINHILLAMMIIRDSTLLSVKHPSGSYLKHSLIITVGDLQVLLLMRNLTFNLSSPDFEPLVSLAYFHSHNYIYVCTCLLYVVPEAFFSLSMVGNERSCALYICLGWSSMTWNAIIHSHFIDRVDGKTKSRLVTFLFLVYCFSISVFEKSKPLVSILVSCFLFLK